ncbi:hypothetical protein RFI_22401 [Reticulomyxa filosa]|uniref:Uncharacterized protein n=1 Tax=Reticulomyxa filosa TaxID=46433 RepID=X6MMU2_RETFI|nr:hypothetical protein RFI_22401 [Reticulomyxa filosa]|eukprot:ETO14966.1 hypothetical protein RFI_22401 [Reticulomyxa filosa]
MIKICAESIKQAKYKCCPKSFSKSDRQQKLVKQVPFFLNKKNEAIIDTRVFVAMCNLHRDFSTYSFVVIEKGQGENGTIPGYYAEDYMLQAAQQLKAADPGLQVYFYLNSVLDWPMYRMHYVLEIYMCIYTFLNHSKWWLRNYTQNVDHISGDPSFNGWENMLVFDLSQQDCLSFWATECLNMTLTGYFDGCNADRVYSLLING